MTKHHYCAKHGNISQSTGGTDCPQCELEDKAKAIPVCNNAAAILATQFPTITAGDHKSGYETLRQVLDVALAQASVGKGVQRHGYSGKHFEDQQIVAFGKSVKSIVYNVGQANKKASEAIGLEPKPAIRELLGAINYLAAAVLILCNLHNVDLPKE